MPSSLARCSIFTIGPSFKLNAQATGDLNIDLDMKVDIAYTVNNAQLTFPPDQGTFRFAPDRCGATVKVRAPGEKAGTSG